MKRSLLITALFLLASAPVASAQEGCAGRLTRLVRYAGTYDDYRILNDRAVAAALQRVVGADLDHLMENLGVRGPADYISCHLVISGLAPHSGGSEDGIVAVNVTTGAVSAAIHSEGRITVYAEEGPYSNVPIPIKDWLAVVVSGLRYRISLPPSARQVGPQGRR